ncbi:uncharacterized protein IUM83_09458 [Phytophthora cinnamomi]|uniref:uncharacterized protein n=1 Tax=Phytophthora cinnamomi TaxID=4785 RepID=UPI003559B575|nr:hypothetical protein IUM83_09458 [Phytophthora cinnamomi]
MAEFLLLINYVEATIPFVFWVTTTRRLRLCLPLCLVDGVLQFDKLEETHGLRSSEVASRERGGPICITSVGRWTSEFVK